MAVEGHGCWFDDDPDIYDDNNKDIEAVDDFHSPEWYFFPRLSFSFNFSSTSLAGLVAAVRSSTDFQTQVREEMAISKNSKDGE